MSVYTSVSPVELQVFLGKYALGDLLSCKGIAAGITNSNYWLETESGAYVLTIFEHYENRNLDYILGLQHYLAQQNIACAMPSKDTGNKFYSILNGKPAAIIEGLSGEVCQQLTARHCASIAAELARFHLAGKNFTPVHDNPCGTDWLLSMQQQLSTVMDESNRQLLAEELKAYQSLSRLKMPQGAVHADLFHDNALFDGHTLVGIIDFEFACHDFWLYDLAVAINDWCIIGNGEFDTLRLSSFIEAYERLRPLLDVEHDTLLLMLRLVATRFWLSRLYDQTFPLSGELTFVKDPNEFRDILLLRRESTLDLLTNTKT